MYTVDVNWQKFILRSYLIGQVQKHLQFFYLRT